jgi:hypothetical protein
MQVNTAPSDNLKNDRKTWFITGVACCLLVNL